MVKQFSNYNIHTNFIALSSQIMSHIYMYRSPSPCFEATLRGSPIKIEKFGSTIRKMSENPQNQKKILPPSYTPSLKIQASSLIW